MDVEINSAVTMTTKNQKVAYEKLIKRLQQCYCYHAKHILLAYLAGLLALCKMLVWLQTPQNCTEFKKYITYFLINLPIQMAINSTASVHCLYGSQTFSFI